MDYGDFVWFEILTDETDRTIDFYTDVVGWTMTEMEVGEQEPYRMFAAGDMAIAGVIDEAPSPGLPTGWLGYIACRDLERTTERARELGAEVLGDILESEGIGRYDFLKEPGGGVFSAFEPDDFGRMGDIHQNKPGHFGWCELNTHDSDASMTFFNEIFGWQEGASMDVGGGQIYQMFTSGGADFGGLNDLAEMEAAIPAGWNYYFTVADLDESFERAKEHGATILYEPMEVPGGDRVFASIDPMGSMVSFFGK
jgi:hypothetical protein